MCSPRERFATTSFGDIPILRNKLPGSAAALIASAASCICSGALKAQHCSATSASMTPLGWHAPTATADPTAHPGLELVQQIRLPGPANRFDYQSFDASSGRLYMNHMDAGETLVFDVDSDRIIGDIRAVPRATGVWAVPAHHKIYISAAGAHEVTIADDRTLRIVGNAASCV